MNDTDTVGEVEAETTPESQEIDGKVVLATVSHLRNSSVGLDDGSNGAKLDKDRKRALEYFRGEMPDMEPEGINRSNATDSYGADVIETILPDLVEILTDEDAVVFDPQDDDDIEQARIETDLIQDVILVDNDGFLEIYTALKDSLQLKLGVWKFWGEDHEETKEERLAVTDLAAVPALLSQAKEMGFEGRFEDSELVLTKTAKSVKPKFKAIPPETFGALDTGPRIKGGDYCVERTMPRIQDIRGLYEDSKIDALTTLDDTNLGEDVEDARDTQDDIGETGALLGDMRRVRLYEHYVRSDFDGDGIKLWQVVTDDKESTLIHMEEVSRFPYAVVMPFVNPHRMIGESMMDKCMELQRIRTNLLRQMIDAGNIATNGRVEIGEDDSTEDTFDDFQNNDIGGIIRSKTGNAVNPLRFGELGFDVLGALEYSATAGEQRSGVGRQTQGLNSDAMHDTATGQQSLLSRSQRRTRMIARIMAETGFRDLCLGLHAIIRESGGEPSSRHMRGKFMQIDPQAMGERDTMRVVVGGGSREEAMAIVRDILGLMTQVVELQGGLQGPIADIKGVHKVLSRYTDLMPIRGLRDIWMSPHEAEQQEPEAPPPDPQMIKVQGELQNSQAKMQMDAQAEAQKMQLEREKAQAEMQLAEREMALKEFMALRGGQQPEGGGFHPGGALNR